jgi:anti-sigma regulatory factor (Ser/Thr protein kinase)
MTMPAPHPDRAAGTSASPPVMLLDVDLGRDLSQVRGVRHDLARALEAIGQAAVSPDVLLVASELVTNAITYAADTVHVSVCRDDAVLRVEVHDDGEGRPAVQEVDCRVPHGRGLLIVEQATTAWGVDYRVRPGKTVWCEFPLT